LRNFFLFLWTSQLMIMFVSRALPGFGEFPQETGAWILVISLSIIISIVSIIWIRRSVDKCANNPHALTLSERTQLIYLIAMAALALGILMFLFISTYYETRLSLDNWNTIYISIPTFLTSLSSFIYVLYTEKQKEIHVFYDFHGLTIKPKSRID